jgi:hypothetical protein
MNKRLNMLYVNNINALNNYRENIQIITYMAPPFKAKKLFSSA